MYTRCPACQSAFRVTAATLRAAHGQVVCATCHTTFDALFGLMDELPPAPVAAAIADANALLEELESPLAPDEVTLLHIPGSATDWTSEGPPQVAHALAQALAHESARGAPPDSTLESAQDTPAQPPTVELDDDDPTGTWAPPSFGLESTPPTSSPNPAPVAAQPESPSGFFTLGGTTPQANQGTAEPPSASGDEVLDAWIEEQAPPRRRGWVWTLASLVLVMALGAQALHHWRQSLVHHPALGPGVAALYAAIGLPLAPESDLLAFQVTAGTVGPAPDTGALRMSAVVTNRSHHALALPLLQVTLEDRYGAPIGRRAFGPGEYAPAHAMVTVPARSNVTATLDLADPGNEAVGFKLDVCEAAATGLTCATDLRESADLP